MKRAASRRVLLRIVAGAADSEETVVETTMFSRMGRGRAGLEDTGGLKPNG
jgi:hypothetical protein